MDFPLTGKFLAGRRREVLQDEDRHLLEEAFDEVLEYPDATKIQSRAGNENRCCLVVEGFVFKIRWTGQQRCIVGVAVPGDFIDLPNYTLAYLDYEMVAAGPVKLATLPHYEIDRIAQTSQPIARALWLATLIDASIHRQWIEILERLDAPRRIIHIYTELFSRLGLDDCGIIHCLRTPFKQRDLADMCGLSAIHVNRAIAKLRADEIADIRRGDLYTSDWGKLRKFARFDPRYLYMSENIMRDGVLGGSQA